MDIIISGVITQVMQPQTGVSQKNGNAWMKQQYVICHDQGQYPKFLSFGVFGQDKIQQMNIQPNEYVTVHIDANATQSQKDGKWYNDLRCWKVDRQQPGMPQGMPMQQPMMQGGYAPQGYQQPMQGGYQQQMVQQPMQQAPFPPAQQPMQQQMPPQQTQAPFPPAQGQAMPPQQPVVQPAAQPAQPPVQQPVAQPAVG